ncbi:MULTISPECIES: XRE family transcriptional regulator [Acinetobacter calcoaceticus/baumannii complex]|uniref:XRE family transcriptional regulator n=1 Tax=Acinetobacter calcoaceticus/baumannii complex TaxID=909768 RepID=UPI002A0695B0|nr:XRE family transcriptional regulator [Acinetobacter pittii]MDX8159192.1 XRE family transcriptional regulator [Acinetobacter pittii]MDX8263813.1 XRE family transcriptional regulator [Acinetobacter pittii]
MTTQFNGLELKLLRQFNELSLEDLGIQLNLTRQYLHKVETGQTIPNDQFIDKVAHFFNVPQTFFMQLKPVLQEDQIHFRSNRTAKVSFKQIVIARGEYIKRLIEYLDSKLRLPKYDIHTLYDEPIDQNPAIESIAEQCREKWGLGLGPISSMVRLCETHGIIVTTFSSISKEVDALSLATKRPIFVRNEAKESVCRQRFDLAHELGHLVLHDGLVTGDRLTESQANHFASALLIPQVMMRTHFHTWHKNGRYNWSKLSEFKQTWKVSKAAILYRARQLGLLTPEQYTSGVIYLKKTGEGLTEKEDHLIPSEKPELLKVCFSALSKKRIFAEDVANSLNINVDFLENLVGMSIPRKPSTLKIVKEST